MSKFYVISGSEDGDIKVWDPNKGNIIRGLTGHSDAVYGLEGLHDRIISGAWDNQIRIWDKNTGECLKKIDRHSDKNEVIMIVIIY